MILHKAEKPLHGTVRIPGDKSVSHRAVMLGSLAKGDTEIDHFLPGADCISTINCFRQMDIEIDTDPDNPEHVTVHGNGLHGLTAPDDILDCGNSGTTTRLISGILSGQKFTSHLTGDSSLVTRPMKRIIDPLTMMGAGITSDRANGCLPLTIKESRLTGIDYRTPVASAQVKSCILLAGMYADGATTVTEPYPSRDHTERMLRNFGADLNITGTSVTIKPDPYLTASHVNVPGDISSAAYFIAAAAMIKDSDLLLLGVGTNPTRDGILRVLQDMGGTVVYRKLKVSNGEPSADLEIRYAPLHGTVIEGSLIPALIDEIPVIAVMAASAEGDTIIRNAEELKVKESDRLDIMTKGLASMGADIEPTEDGMIIHGGKPLHGAVIESHMDHRVAMSFATAALCAEGDTEIRNAECVNISYPDFYKDLAALCS